MSEAQKKLIEVLGGIVLVAGIAVIHIAAALVVAGVLMIVFANFSDTPKESDDANPQ